MIEENYNKEVRKFLDELGLKVSALCPIFKISKDMVSQKFMPNYPRPPFTQEDFHKIITYFKNKSNELYSKHIYTRQSKD